VAAVPLTVVHDELEAEVVCGLLRVNGIQCGYRPSAAGSAVWGMTPAVGGQTEVLVDETDLERAREILESDETEPGEQSP
jgi:hypothetical protein